MPIVEVEIVSGVGEVLPANLARLLADRLGEIFATAPGATWVKVRILREQDYAENDMAESGTLRPAFVTVLKRDLPEEPDLRTEVNRITRIVAQVCSRPVENVHVIYQPPGGGRVAFGGRLI